MFNSATHAPFHNQFLSSSSNRSQTYLVLPPSYQILYAKRNEINLFWQKFWPIYSIPIKWKYHINKVIDFDLFTVKNQCAFMLNNGYLQGKASINDPKWPLAIPTEIFDDIWTLLLSTFRKWITKNFIVIIIFVIILSSKRVS